MARISDTIEQLQRNTAVCIAFIVLFCFASFGLPLLLGLPAGYDMITDIRFASALQDAMSSGEFFPGWANDNFGFGSIGIRFYPPVAFYLLAFTELLTADWFWALWANLLFWMTIGSIGIFAFVKEWGTPGQGLIAAIGYAIVPQHLGEVFQFFLFAEFAAWGVIPFCFLFLTRICRGGGWVDAVWFAFAYSILVLTHLPTTIIVSLCFPIYVLITVDWSQYRKVFSRLVFAVALTMSATLFRWVTIIGESDWLAHNDDRWAQGYFEYSSWLFPNSLATREQFVYVLTSWLFDISILMTIALITPALVYLLKARKNPFEHQRQIIGGAVCTALFAFFMLSRPSYFVWEVLPFLQKLQFPWRWLSMVSFAAVIAFAWAVPRLLALFQHRERFVAYPALALVVTIILFNITQIIIPSGPIPYAEFDKVENEVAEEPMFEGWWPVWAKREAFTKTQLVTAGTRQTDISEWNALERAFTVQPGDPVKVRLATFYYPHWRAYVNHQPAAVEPANDGSILVTIPGDYSVVRVMFEEPLRASFTRGISTMTWVGFGAFMIVVWRRRAIRSFE